MQRIRAAYIFLFLGAVTGTERATALEYIAAVPGVSGARDVALWGDVALVGCSTWTPGAVFNNSGLHRIDISNPRVPVVQTPSPLHPSVNLPNEKFAADEIDVASGVAVLAANRFSYEQNFGWLDLSRENPHYLDGGGGSAIDCFPPYYCWFETHDLVVAGDQTMRVNITYSGEYGGQESNTSSLSVCQFGKPPQECTERYQFSSSHDHFFTGVDGAGDFVFLAGSIRPDLPKGLHILRWMNGEVELVSSIETGGDARKVRVKGDFAYIADGHGGLKVVDWSQPYCPRLVGEVVFPGDAINLTLGIDQLVVTSGEGGVTLIDVVDPTFPLVMSRYDTPGYAYGAAIDGRYIYVADGQTGLVVLRNWLNVRPSPTPTPTPFPCVESATLTLHAATPMVLSPGPLRLRFYSVGEESDCPEPPCIDELMLDCLIDCSAWSESTPASSAELTDALMLQITDCLDSNLGTDFVWSPVTHGAILVRSVAEFSVGLCGDEIGDCESPSDPHLLNDSPLYNLCNGIAGDESSIESTSGIGFSIAEGPCPAIPNGSDCFTHTPTPSPSPTSSLTLTQTPIVPPESYDIAPGSGDGKVDAVDLMEWLARVRGEQLQPPPLFGFSLQWGGQTD